jgi:curved DNA-binding protein CbpA
MIDFYEFLQISPNADAETIHRVYRFLATRFHPDNQNSGDAGMFSQLKKAYDVLSNPALRAEYDVVRRKETRPPLSSSVDFMDDLEGESNRRLAVLAVLYQRRRTSPNMPEVSLAQIEERMGFPRDYLDFTMWYLQKKSYVMKSDSAQYALTADGVDFVESERAKLPTLHRLLTSGSEIAAEWQEYPTADVHVLNSVSAGASTMHSQKAPVVERRGARKERRVGAPDTRLIKVERRGHVKNRRSDSSERRTVNQV